MSFFGLWQTKKDDLIVALINDRSQLQAELRDLKLGWVNPEGWSIYTGNYEGITGVTFPLNTCLSINDKNIKLQALRLKGKDINETASNVEKWLNNYITYSFDKDNNFHKGYIEWWQQASLTFALKRGDCDDYAIVFQTMMHILGYGDKVITCAGDCDFSAFKQGMVGHAFNKVLIDGVWTNFDACNGAFNRSKIKYPDLKDNWFFMNYWNTYKI